MKSFIFYDTETDRRKQVVTS